MENTVSFVKIDDYNLKHYYNKIDGNIYFKNAETGLFEVADGLTYEELCDAMNFCFIKLIWIAGPSLGTEVRVNY